MNQADYAAMTDEQLKRHIVENREDKAALRAYAERCDKQDFPVIANVKDISDLVPFAFTVRARSARTVNANGARSEI
jgi:hypothetical protein